ERHADLQQAERELASAATIQAPADARRWADLTAGVESLDIEVRDQVRQLVMDTFERIVVWMRGRGGDRTCMNIDVLLISRAGQRRMLRIDRRSGAWVASEEWGG